MPAPCYLLAFALISHECVDRWNRCAGEAAAKCPPLSDTAWSDEDRWWAHHCRETCGMCMDHSHRAQNLRKRSTVVPPNSTTPGGPPRFAAVQVYAGHGPAGLAPGERAFTWQGQVGQDHAIAALFAGNGAGYFVDLAANRPVHHSNTRALERDFGWRGLCIEPNPRLTLDLAAQRTCVVVNAVVSQTGRGILWRESARKHWASSIVEKGAGDAVEGDDANSVTFMREAVSLIDILDANSAPRHISYLSLDVEGAEDQVLTGFNFSRYVFLAITLERPSVALKRRLNLNNYVYIFEHGNHGDELWAHRTIPGGTGRAKRVAQACWRRWMASPKHKLAGGYIYDEGTPDTDIASAAGHTEPACRHVFRWMSKRRCNAMGHAICRDFGN